MSDTDLHRWGSVKQPGTEVPDRDERMGTNVRLEDLIDEADQKLESIQSDYRDGDVFDDAEKAKDKEIETLRRYSIWGGRLIAIGASEADWDLKADEFVQRIDTVKKGTCNKWMREARDSRLEAMEAADELDNPTIEIEWDHIDPEHDTWHDRIKHIDSDDSQPSDVLRAWSALAEEVDENTTLINDVLGDSTQHNLKRMEAEVEIEDTFIDRATQLLIRGLDSTLVDQHADLLADSLKTTKKGRLNEKLSEQYEEQTEELVENGELDWYHVRTDYEFGSVKGARQLAVRLLRTKEHFASPRGSDKIWMYDDETGVYHPEGVDRIGELLTQLEEHETETERKEITGKIKARDRIDRDEFDGGRFPNDPLIPAANGTVNIETDEREDHHPEYLWRASVAPSCNPDSECPAIDSFLSEITATDEHKQFLYEIAGFCLTRGYDPAAFFILHGSGGNGKSIYFNLLEAFLGSDNTSHADLHDLADSDYSVAQLQDKLANIGGDIPGARLGDISTIKALTGGDRKQVREIYESPFELDNRAKLIFGVNSPPILPEAGRQIRRRLHHIELPYEFADDPDPDDPMQKQRRPKGELMAELTTDEELSGFLNRAIEAIQGVRERGRFIIRESESMNKHWKEYERKSDLIRRFGRECCENREGFAVPKSIVYQTYTNFVYENNRDQEPIGEAAFWRQFKKTRLVTDEFRPTFDGDRTVSMDMFWFTEAGFEHCPDILESKLSRFHERVYPDGADADGGGTSGKELGQHRL